MKKFYFFFFLGLLNFLLSNAQTIFNENFDSTPVGTGTAHNAPTGWTLSYIGTHASSYAYVNAYSPAASVPSAPNVYRMNTYKTSSSPVTYAKVYATTPSLTGLSGLTNPRIRVTARGSSTSTTVNPTMVIGYMTNPTDPTTFIEIQQVLLLTTNFVEVLVPIPNSIPNLSFRVDGIATSVGIFFDDLIVEETPTNELDLVIFNNITAHNAVVKSIEPCETFFATTDIYESGVTDMVGQGTGTQVWIGKSQTDSDPATWPESNWALATYLSDNNSNDTYKLDYPTQSIGNYYFATRARINFGPFKYGAINGFWNGSTNINYSLSVNAVLPILAEASSPNICQGDTTDLTASSDNLNYTYSWNNNAGVGTTVTVNPNQTTTYTVTGTNTITGCTNTASVTVVVNEKPSDLTLSTNPETTCSGSISTLTATGGSYFVPIFQESFNGTTHSFSTVNNTSNTGVGFEWILEPNAYIISGTPEITYTTTDGNGFILCQAGSAGSATVNTELVSPSFDLSNALEARMDYDKHLYITYLGNGTTQIYSFNILVSIDGGTNWTNVYTYATSDASSSLSNAVLTPGSVNLDTFVGNSDVKVKFKLYKLGSAGRNWAIDNVKIMAKIAQPPVWSPVTNLFNDEAATIPYDGSPISTVYALVNTNTTYTATVTTPSNCSNTSDVVVNVTEVEAPTGSATQYICSTSPFNTLSDLNVTVTATEVWYDAVTAGNLLPSTTVMLAGTTYYVANQDLGCESIRVAVTVSEDCSLSVDNQSAQNFKVFPNPTSDFITLKSDELIDNVEVINYLGQKVFNFTQMEELKFDMSFLPSGTYLLKVSFMNGSKSSAIFIKK